MTEHQPTNGTSYVDFASTVASRSAKNFHVHGLTLWAAVLVCTCEQKKKAKFLLGANTPREFGRRSVVAISEWAGMLGGCKREKGKERRRR